MLLAIPPILGASAGSGYEIYRSGDIALQQYALLAAVLSFVTAFVAIWGMMAWLRRASFTPFVVYRIALSAVLLAVVAFS
jgi:undecaprenyl-diphosphatase